MTGIIREQLSDFQVDEVLDRTFSGDGEHLYVHVEKRALNTKDVQRLLAQHYGVARVDVSYAGLKDKRAITRQWFSIRQPRTAQRPTHDQFSILAESKHHRKLRPGDHLGNRFRIIVRGVSDNVEFTPDTLQYPIPNYFGPQRFGYQQNNLARALNWVGHSRPHIPREVRGLHLSVLRSFLFNEVLAARVRNTTWSTSINGDVVQDESPTGPMWGRGRLPTTEKALAIERDVRQRHSTICDALEWVGLKQERRSLVMRATKVEIQQEDGTVELRFVLPKGSYATVALNEYFEMKESSR